MRTGLPVVIDDGRDAEIRHRVKAERALAADGLNVLHHNPACRCDIYTKAVSARRVGVDAPHLPANHRNTLGVMDMIACKRRRTTKRDVAALDLDRRVRICLAHLDAGAGNAVKHRLIYRYVDMRRIARRAVTIQHDSEPRCCCFGPDQERIDKGIREREAFRCRQCRRATNRSVAIDQEQRTIAAR